MSSVVVMQCAKDVDREAFNAELLDTVAAAVSDQPQTLGRVTAYTIAGEAAALQSMIGGDSPAMIDGAVIFSEPATAAVAKICQRLGSYSLQCFTAEYRRPKCYPPEAVVDGEANHGQTRGLFMITPTLRKPDMTHAEFDAHWRDNHSPLALRHHTGMWDYYQLPFDRQTLGEPRDYDGLSLMGFASQDDFFNGLFDSPAGQKVIEADIERFLSFDGISPSFLSETVIREV